MSVRSFKETKRKGTTKEDATEKNKYNEIFSYIIKIFLLTRYDANVEFTVNIV